MILAELGLQNFVSRTAYVSPFTFSFTVNIQKLASFWLGVFGCEDERTNERVYILSVIANYTERFAKVETLTECKNTMETWWFDLDNQTLYMNLGLNYNPVYSPLEYLKSFGICDTSVVYVDDVAFLPVLSSAPSIKQKQDLIGYDKLAFNSGSLSLSNEAGILNFLNTMSVFNNDIALFYLDYDGRSEYTREELIPLAWYLLDDADISKKAGKIKMMDVRKSWSRKIPNNLFTAEAYPDIKDNLIDKPIPLLFGAKTVDAICTNEETTTGDVTYRVAERLTALNHVYKIVDDAQVEITPLSVDLYHGEFVLSASDARDGEDPVEVYCDCVGICDEGETFATPLGVIKWIEEEYNNAPFTDSFFDTAEIEAEIGALEPIALYTEKKQVEIYELIRQLQEGSSNRFRYEINASGKRTARIDNLERESIAFVSKEEILENDEMNVYTDKATIAATIKINYDKNELTNTYSTVIDSSQETIVAQNARERPEIEFNTFLQTRELAVARAALEASRLGQVRRFTDVTLRGARFLQQRIYDIITAELIDEYREWVGTWKCQVLAIAPDTDNVQNKVTLLLVERIADVDDGQTLRITTTGAIRKTTTSDDTVRVTK